MDHVLGNDEWRSGNYRLVCFCRHKPALVLVEFEHAEVSPLVLDILDPVSKG